MTLSFIVLCQVKEELCKEDDSRYEEEGRGGEEEIVWRFEMLQVPAWESGENKRLRSNKMGLDIESLWYSFNH